MGLKLDHTHENGKVCFTGRTGRPLTGLGIFRIGGRELPGGYMGYTGSWYFYDPETGEEFITIRSRFGGTDLVESLRVDILINDDDCVPTR